MRMLLASIVFSLMLTGCTIPIGRLVTNVSGGAGEITVEKCSIERNIWTNHYEENDCRSETYSVAK